MSIVAAGSPRRQERDVPRARRVATWLGWWAVLMSLWLLLVDTIAMAELLAGSGAAAIAATLVELAEHQAAVRNRVRAEWIASARNIPVEVLRDTWLVLRVAVGCLGGRRPASAFHVVPVRAGGDDPEDATHRAVLTLGTSLSPNSVVLGVDPESGLMVLHRLVPPPRPRAGERPMAAQ
jgi:multisubunit Na+/H+ antiporter MnhE subunit